MKWLGISETVTGLILDGRLAPSVIQPTSLMPPYDEIVEAYRKDKDLTELITRFSIEPIDQARQAAYSVNGTSKLADWTSLLERSKNNTLAGERMMRLSNKLQQGEDVNWEEVRELANRCTSGIGNGFATLDKVESMEIPFKKTGFNAIDRHFGGFPEVGQVLIGGHFGTGKTSFMVQLAGCWVKEHPEDRVIIYTLEMLKEEIKMRFDELIELTEDQLSRIYIEDAPMTPEETLAKASTVDNLGLVCVDFADLLIRGETTESSMAHIYRTYMLGAKSLYVPVVVLAQLNRLYQGGIPYPMHIRYTSLAEALAWGLIMLYNPNIKRFSGKVDNEKLPAERNHAYIIGWKFRGGFRVHPDDSPGAIRVPFKGNMGWHFEHPGKWYALPGES